MRLRWLDGYIHETSVKFLELQPPFILKLFSEGGTEAFTLSRWVSYMDAEARDVVSRRLESNHRETLREGT